MKTPKTKAMPKAGKIAKMPTGATKASAEKPQGKIKGSGIAKPMKKEAVPQVKPGTTYGKPTQTQKL